MERKHFDLDKAKMHYSGFADKLCDNVYYDYSGTVKSDYQDYPLIAELGASQDFTNLLDVEISKSAEQLMSLEGHDTIGYDYPMAYPNTTGM